jgi:transcriptional regulator with XRE-family HTH domain
MTKKKHQFHDRLLMLRKERKWVLQDAADRTGLSVATINSLETTQQGRIPNRTSLTKLCRAYNVSAKWLLEGGEREPFSATETEFENESDVLASQILEKYQARSAQLLADMATELRRLYRKAPPWQEPNEGN